MLITHIALFIMIILRVYYDHEYLCDLFKISFIVLSGNGISQKIWYVIPGIYCNCDEMSSKTEISCMDQ